MINDSNIAVDVNACLACGRCVDRCIMDNLRLSLPPCRQSCPLDINCQGILRLIALDRDEEAARELRRFTPFGGLLAHVCTAPCETVCSRKRLGEEALDIRGVVRSLAERFADIVHAAAPCAPASGKTAAVLGAGPAGVQAAHDLRMAGHEVTVFVSGERPLADLARAVPAPTLGRTIQTLTDMGVRFVPAAPHTPDAPTPDTLCAAYDAALDCAGLSGERPDTSGRARNNLFAVNGGVSGSSRSVVADMAEAKAVAHTINNILTGFTPDYESDRRAAQGLTRFQGMDEERATPAARVRPASGVFTSGEAKREAGRCLGCGRPYERNQTCWYCLPCEVVCPTRALRVRIPYLIR